MPLTGFPANNKDISNAKLLKPNDPERWIPYIGCVEFVFACRVGQQQGDPFFWHHAWHRVSYVASFCKLSSGLSGRTCLTLEIWLVQPVPNTGMIKLVTSPTSKEIPLQVNMEPTAASF